MEKGFIEDWFLDQLAEIREISNPYQRQKRLAELSASLKRIEQTLVDRMQELRPY